MKSKSKNRAIILVLSPEECAKLFIFNGDLSILVRKKFSKDFVGWVYIYCTKETNNKVLMYVPGRCLKCDKNKIGTLADDKLNGKVIARFWCDKVEEINHTYLVNARSYSIKSCLTATQFSKECCLEQWELDKYLQGKNGYAIHITNLKIFDKPKEISEFVPYNIKQDHYKPFPTCDFRLTRAPQNGWCYVEAEQ